MCERSFTFLTDVRIFIRCKVLLEKVRLELPDDMVAGNGQEGLRTFLPSLASSSALSFPGM